MELPAGSVAALAARTEGWVAGLQLAGLSLHGHAHPVGLVEQFSGSHRYVFDYLTEEVLGRQPEELVGFLLETSILDRLSGSLCDAVTGRTDSQALLEGIERGNLSSTRWMRRAAGGATTTCSPTCSRPEPSSGRPLGPGIAVAGRGGAATVRVDAGAPLTGGT